MRRAEVESQFLSSFESLYPQIGFRGIRRFPRRMREPFAFALRIALGRAAREIDLLCVILTRGHPQEVERCVARVQELTASEGPPEDAMSVLVAPYLAPDARSLCRQAAMGYFDLAGNAGLDGAGVYMDITGKSNQNVRKRQVTTPFEGKAERIVRCLLLSPKRRWRMRELAAEAGVSLGLASMVTTMLADNGVLSKSRSGLDLFDPGALLEAWSQNYDLRKSALRVYRSWSGINRLVSRLAAERTSFGSRYALTLWSGAQRLVKEDGVPPHLAIYWSGTVDPLVRALQLDRDVGRYYVFILQPYDESIFWGAEEDRAGVRIAHPVQLYLDLSAGDEEELALAQRLRERLLRW